MNASLFLRRSSAASVNIYGVFGQSITRLGRRKVDPTLTLVQRVVGIRFKEQILQSDHDRGQVKHRFPVLAEDVEADIALEVYVGMIDLAKWARDWRRYYVTDTQSTIAYLGYALDFGRIVGIVGVDGE